MKTIKNLIVFGALGILLVGANSASAYVPGVWDPQPRSQNLEPAFTKVPNPYDPPVVIQKTTVINNKVTSTESTNNVSDTTVNKTTTNTSDVNSNKLLPTVNTDENGNLLGASAANSGGFLPNTVGEWLLVITLILIIIIITRRLNKKPVNHAHGDIHPVPAH